MRARLRVRSASPSTAPDATTAGPASQLVEALDTTSTEVNADAEALAGAAASVRTVGAESFRPQPTTHAERHAIARRDGPGRTRASYTFVGALYARGC